MQQIEIDWKPDKTSTTPVYQQIIDYISTKVSQGEWLVGSRLPSQRKLAEQFEVNRSTIVTAMEELASYGMIEGGFGSGTRIASNTWSLLMSSPPDWGRYIQSGPFRANVPTIQTINSLEFKGELIRMGTGELSPSLYSRERMRKVLSALPDQVDPLGYLCPLGLPELRKAIAARLTKQGLQVQQENILITSGALQALQLISVCILRSGATVYTEAPTYLKSLQIFQSAGMHLCGIPMDQNGLSYWTLKKIETGSLLYTIPTHQNPTGTVMSKARRQELYDFCSANRLPMIEDSAYSDLWFEQEPPAPIKSLDENGMILYLGTVSKSIAPGLRIGWLVGPAPVVERLGDAKMQTDYGASSLSQWAVTELLQSGLYEEQLTFLRVALRERRDLMLSFLAESFSDLAVWNKPTGGFYIWLTFRAPVSIERLFQQALAHGILLNPGTIYDFSENHSLRLSYAYASPDQMRWAIKTLAGLARKCV